MIDRSVSLSTSNGYYRTEQIAKDIWITKPVDVLDVQVNYEVLPDDRLPSSQLPVAKARRIRKPIDQNSKK